MNAVIFQMLYCLIIDVLGLSRQRKFLPTIEMVVNSLPNRSIGCSPCYLMYGYRLVLCVRLLKGDESTNVETSSKFLERTQEVWHQARVQIE